MNGAMALVDPVSLTRDLIRKPSVTPADEGAMDLVQAELERREPRRLALIHFGVFDDVERHLGALRETMHEWGARVAHGMDEATFVAAAREGDVLVATAEQEAVYGRNGVTRVRVVREQDDALVALFQGRSRRIG